MPDPWPSWKNEQLRELAKDQSLTNGHIADILSVSRNAVAGKLHRWKMYRPRPINHKPKPKKPPRKPKNFSSELAVWKTPGFPVDPTPLPPVEPAQSHAVGLLELRHRHCRYVVDDNKFCGDKRVRGAYCDYHAERCYLPPRPPRYV
jgi:hypothetical protein